MYKIHVGQKFYFSNCEMEVLYTLESLAPDVATCYNESSNIIKMTFGGKTTYLSTGDATGKAMNVISKTFGSHIQCDIIQVCHHGYSTFGYESEMIAAYKKTISAIRKQILIENCFLRFAPISFISRPRQQF